MIVAFRARWKARAQDTPEARWKRLPRQERDRRTHAVEERVPRGADLAAWNRAVKAEAVRELEAERAAKAAEERGA